VGFHALAAIGLKCALGHRNALLSPLEYLRLNGKTQVYRRLGQESSAEVTGFTLHLFRLHPKVLFLLRFEDRYSI
jgi:hypothetical protein